MNALVDFIASHPGMAGRLLTQHVNDGRGRCRCCTYGGQPGWYLWPCTLAALAAAAEQLQAAARRDGPPPAESSPGEMV